jgi:mersacidin/lichenicidin family type 2 lantibiotic
MQQGESIMSVNQTPLTDEEVVRAYRESDFRDTLTAEQILYATSHPLAPADAIPAELELSDEDLDAVAGGSIGSVCSVCSVCTLCSWCDIFAID